MQRDLLINIGKIDVHRLRVTQQVYYEQVCHANKIEKTNSYGRFAWAIMIDLTYSASSRLYEDAVTSECTTYKVNLAQTIRDLLVSLCTLTNSPKSSSVKQSLLLVSGFCLTKK
jgi:hypothetical protein